MSIHEMSIQYTLNKVTGHSNYKHKKIGTFLKRNIWYSKQGNIQREAVHTYIPKILP
jgi:hypothetical protein